MPLCRVCLPTHAAAVSPLRWTLSPSLQSQQALPNRTYGLPALGPVAPASIFNPQQSFPPAPAAAPPFTAFLTTLSSPSQWYAIFRSLCRILYCCILHPCRGCFPLHVFLQTSHSESGALMARFATHIHHETQTIRMKPDLSILPLSQFPNTMPSRLLRPLELRQSNLLSKMAVEIVHKKCFRYLHISARGLCLN